MKRKVFCLIFGAMVASVATHSSAFGLGDLTGAPAGGGASSVSAKDLVGLYIGSGQMVANGQTKLLKAVGLKEEAEKNDAKAKDLTNGATSEALEDAVKVQTAGSKAMAEKLASGTVQMTAEGKKEYTAGLVDFAKGLTGYVAMASSVSKYKPGMSDIGAAAGSAMYIVKSLPATTENVTATLKQAIAFAKENKIEMPKEVDAFSK